MKRIGITTIDNPFDCLDDFENWFLFDIEKGYYTCNKLARIANTFDGMTNKEENDEIERAIDRLIEIDPLNVYEKVIRDELKASER